MMTRSSSHRETVTGGAWTDGPFARQAARNQARAPANHDDELAARDRLLEEIASAEDSRAGVTIHDIPAGK